MEGDLEDEAVMVKKMQAAIKAGGDAPAPFSVLRRLREALLLRVGSGSQICPIYLPCA